MSADGIRQLKAEIATPHGRTCKAQGRSTSFATSIGAGGSQAVCKRSGEIVLEKRLDRFELKPR